MTVGRNYNGEIVLWMMMMKLCSWEIEVGIFLMAAWHSILMGTQAIAYRYLSCLMLKVCCEL
jgi:hypothetical protein